MISLLTHLQFLPLIYLSQSPLLLFLILKNIISLFVEKVHNLFIDVY